MAKNVSLTIDGKNIKAPEGTNLIDAAETAGIHIPNLCYLKGTKAVGACRLCLVEVEGQKGHAIACNTKVKEGMAVRTDTPEILEARKFVIDLIVSMHPLDCMTCTKASICNLQRYAYDFEIQESSFKRKKFGHAVDMGNPFIKMSPDYCVLCGRCVRVCKEQGTNVLEFMGRGVGAKVSTVVDRSLHESNCTFCGSCIDACPVNAIIEYDRVRKGREWEYKKTNSVCMLCGNACDIKVSTKGNEIARINAGAEKGSAMKYICAYGRFGFDYINSDSRLLAPMKRVKGELVETTWDDAVATVADNLKKDTGIVSVASIMNEDALAIKHFADDVLKTKNYDTTMSLYADPKSLMNSEHSLIKDADLIVLVGIDPSQRYRVLPALNVAIRKRVARGAKLVVINARDTKLDKVANIHMRGDEIAALKGMFKAAIEKSEGLKVDKKFKDALKDANVSQAAADAADLLVKAEHPVLFSSPALFDAASNMSLIKGKSMAISYESNSKGVAHMGLVSKGKGYKEIVSGGMKSLVVIGDVPLNHRPDCDFLVVVSSHITELSRHADVLLPATTAFETSGTIIDYKGRLRDVPALVEPAGDSMSYREIIARLAKAMGKALKVKDTEISKTAKHEPEVAFSPMVKRVDLDVAPEVILEAVSASLLNSTRMVWLKELERGSVL